MADIDVIANDGAVRVVATVAGQDDFDFDFLAYSSETLTVFFEPIAGDVAPLTLGLDFTVSGLSQENGGTVTLIGAYAGVTEVGDELLIYRETPIERLFDYQVAGDFRAETVNRELDIMIMIDQEARRDIDRSPKVPIGDDPIEVQAAPGEVAAFDANGNLIGSGATIEEILSLAGVEAGRALVYPEAPADPVYAAGGRRIGNMGAGVADTDAATVGQVRAGGARFATKALAAAFDPATSPDFVQLDGNLVLGDLGERVTLALVGAEPTHPGKLQIANGDWYELVRGMPINPYFFETAAHAGDHSLAFSDAADCLVAYGGGVISYPHRAEAMDWNTALVKTFPDRMKLVVDFGTNRFEMGPELFLGGAYEVTQFLTLQGGAAIDISADVSQLYTNYMKMSVDVATYGLRVGDRIYISDSVNTWNGGDGRPCHFATIDYVDETNDIITFYPGISIAVTVSNVGTGQISMTGMVVQAYPEDADITVRGGNFYGDRHPIGVDPGYPGQQAGGASPFGLQLMRGRGVVDGSNFYDLCTSLRFKEGSFRYINSENQGSYNGYGVKVDTRCHVMIDNCVITGSRHAVGIGGSHPDGATGFISNSIVGGARQTFASSTYPSEEFGAFDNHPSSIWAEAHNCLIIGSCTHDNGHMTIVGGRIVTQQIEGIAKFPGQGRSGGSFSLIDVVIEVHPFTPAYNEGGGAGTFGGASQFFRSAANLSTSNNWRLYWKGGSVVFPRAGDWSANQDFDANIAEFIWSHVEIDGVHFVGEGSVRRILINARGDGSGHMIIRNCEFTKCALSVLNEPALDDWKALFIEGNKVLNLGTGPAASAIDVVGDTGTTGVLLDIIIRGNWIESNGTTAMITMSSSARRLTSVKDNTCIFALAGGTLGQGIRTHRNQNATGQWMRALSEIRGNKIISRGASMASPNTITAGIQALGLDSVGGLSAGQYYVGDNLVETATTKLTTTGSAVTTV